MLTFDQASDWTATGTTISPSSLTTQGTGAIALAPTHSARLSSRNFHTGELMGVTSRLGFDVHIPDLPPDYYWFGGMNAFVECPSAGLWNAHLGYRALQILFDGEYNRLEFDLPLNVASVLQGSYTDCRFHLDIATNPALGPIGIDNGGFVQ